MPDCGRAAALSSSMTATGMRWAWSAATLSPSRSATSGRNSSVGDAKGDAEVDAEADGDSTALGETTATFVAPVADAAAEGEPVGDG